MFSNRDRALDVVWVSTLPDLVCRPLKPNTQTWLAYLQLWSGTTQPRPRASIAKIQSSPKGAPFSPSIGLENNMEIT